MQREFYTSCIKINGIPLLPPLMTDSIKEEMKNYRFLAVKVEEKLKAKQFVKRTIKNKCMLTDMEPINKLINIKCSSDNYASNYNIISDINDSDSYSKIATVEHIPIMHIAEEIKNEDNNQTSTSNIKYSQFQSCLINDIVNNSDTTTKKIDQSRCVNATDTMLNRDLISSEICKPDVPRTLDIIPITLSNHKCEKDDNTHSCTTASKESGNPSKLLRQDSYVLDAPSPILLAHVYTEFTDHNYVPTPTTINISQRKQWNIMQPKMEWENKHFVAESDDLGKSYQTNKSEDCTEAIITKKHTSKSNMLIEHNHIFNTSLENKNLSEKSNRDDNIRVLNLVNKLQESMENLNSPGMQLVCTDGKMHDKIDSLGTEEYQDLVIKAKSSITSEKLFTVYKEIEEMHKTQMIELMDRQQKEQSLLQAEFEKQQMLLLAEIQKCSSGVPYQVDILNIMSNQSEASNETTLGDVREKKSQLNNSLSLHTEIYCNSKLSSASHANIVIWAVNIINAYTRGYLVRRLMRTERVITLKKIYKEALQCMLKLHVDAPLNLAEVNFLHRLQLQCDAASMNLVELFGQSPAKRMKVITQDREIKQFRTERPTSAQSYSFATQKTLARKSLKEFESTTKCQRPLIFKRNIVRSRCQTWTSDIREKLMSPNTLKQSIRRSTSAGTVRKPWR